MTNFKLVEYKFNAFQETHKHLLKDGQTFKLYYTNLGFRIDMMQGLNIVQSITNTYSPKRMIDCLEFLSCVYHALDIKAKLNA